MKTLINVFRALSTHIYEDVTRPHLSGVHALDAHTLEATDGARLLRVKLKTPHGLTPGAVYPVKPGLARLRAGILPEPTDTGGRAFPDTAQVIPALESPEHKAARIVALNAEFLADASASLALAVGGKTVKTRVQFPTDPLDPVRLDAEGEAGVAVAVLASMRQ